MISEEKLNNIAEISLNKTFVKETEKIEEYLCGLKNELNAFDKTNPSKEKRKLFIEANKENIFNVLNEHFMTIWEISSDFTREEFISHKDFYQKKLLPWLSTPPLNKRIYEKPLGYPGDYIMMNYYYDDGYEGNSTYEMLLHRYTLELQIARAHINRKYYFKDRLKQVAMKASNTKKAKITSYGCGPASEIVEFICEEPELSKRCVFSCVDIEPAALDQIKGQISNIKHSSQIEINYEQMNILSLIKKHKSKKLVNSQDFVYAAGLLDYFNDRMAARILRALYSMLSESGMLIVVNVYKHHNSRAYMEMVGDWYLNLRDESDLLNLAKDNIAAKEKFVERDAENGKNLYLIIRK